MDDPFRHFDKIFVINEKDNEERHSYVKQVLGELEIDYEFFDAVMGEALSKEEIKAVYDEEKAKKHKTNKRPLSKPEVGCALSHINVYKKIIADDLNNALIFEDDIVPNFKILNQIDDAMQELPTDWDLLHFGTLDHFKKAPLSFKLKLVFYYPFVAIFSPEKLSYTYWQLWNLYSRNYSNTLKKGGYHLGCHAYAMSRSGAEKFLNYHDMITTPVDNMLSVMVVEGELNGYITKELIFDQNKDLASAIENSRLSIREALKKERLSK